VKTLLKSTVLALSLATAATALDVSASDRAALAKPDASLSGLRAGKSDGPAAVAATEREALLRAAAASPQLETLRAGDHDDMTVVAVVLAVVLLIIII